MKFVNRGKKGSKYKTTTKSALNAFESKKINKVCNKFHKQSVATLKFTNCISKKFYRVGLVDIKCH